MIKTIAFDLREVYFAANAELTMRKVSEKYNIPLSKLKRTIESLCGLNQPMRLCAKGKITAKEAWSAFGKLLGVNKKASDDISEMWHAFRTVNPGMSDLVAALRKKYRVIVFTSIPKYRFEYLDKKFSLHSKFDDFIKSYEIGYVKKEEKFYDIFIDRLTCEPEECVAIDDRKYVVAKLKERGVKTILFKDANQVAAALKKLGVKI